MDKVRSTRSQHAVFAATLLLAPATASAQGADVARAATLPKENTDDAGDILVIAQRRSERLVDVPMAVTAVSQDDLVKTGSTNITDLARMTPSLIMAQQTGGFLQPAIRGVSSTGANLGDSSNVALYIDGIYQAQQVATMIDLPDIQQVEVLKGPQGTLYGQNATGGAILVTSLAPSFTTKGMLAASYGNFNDRVVRGYLTGPVTQNVAVSLSGGFQQRDGFRRHIITGERDGGLESKVIRGKIIVEPAEALKLTLSGFYSDRRDSNGYAGHALNGNSVGYALYPTAPRVTSNDYYGTDPDVYSHNRVYGGSAKGELSLDIGSLTGVVSYLNNKVDYRADVDFSPVDYATALAYPRLAGHYTSAELNFASRQFGGLSFLLGAFYLNGSEIFDNNVFTISAPTLPPAPSGPQLFQQVTSGRLDKEVIAFYADATLRVTDKLTVTAGGRYTHEKQRAFQGNPQPQTEYPGGASYSQFTPRVTARYELTPASNFYLSWGRGFKSGLINTGNFNQAPVKPETITSYEAGFKGRIGSVLSLDLSVFHYDYNNLQFANYIPPNYITLNAASARINGVDLDAKIRVSPDLTLSAGGSLLDGKYRRFPSAQIFVPNATGAGNDVAFVDLAGKRMLRSPKFSGNVSIDYSTETPIGRFGAFASLYHTSRWSFDVSGRVGPSAYSTVNGELSLEPKSLENLRLVAWVKNLTNEEYLQTFLLLQFADGVNYGDPRTYGLRVEYRF